MGCTAKMLGLVHFPRHPQTILSSALSMRIPVVRLEMIKFTTPKQLAKRNQQNLIEAVHKSLQALVYGGSSIRDFTLQAMSPCPSKPHALHPSLATQLILYSGHSSFNISEKETRGAAGATLTLSLPSPAVVVVVLPL